MHAYQCLSWARTPLSSFSQEEYCPEVDDGGCSVTGYNCPELHFAELNNRKMVFS